MEITDRIAALATLGEYIARGRWPVDLQAVQKANPWFTPSNVDQAIQGILKFLDFTSLQEWVSTYPIQGIKSKSVGIIMAGNIPLVGFHDLLCVLICGYKAHVKLSGRDQILLVSLYEALLHIAPGIFKDVTFVNHLPSGIDVVIATGSDNTARYLHYHYRSTPRIIRKNRTSHAVLDGSESTSKLKDLNVDMFSYFGKGCRNVSKVWIPSGYNFDVLRSASAQYAELMQLDVYANNYRYQKAVLLSMEKSFHDFQYVLFSENAAVVSPVGTVYYQYYEAKEDVLNALGSIPEKLQCVVSEHSWWPNRVPLGRAQFPELKDYADGVDTMEFLLSKT